jgi:hypothetical protein
MSMFATFAAPTSTPSYAVDGSGSSGFFEGDEVVRALDAYDFGLLLRAVDLVVLSQAFSRLGLQYALRIPADTAARMTRFLEMLGVIAPGQPDARRTVLTEPQKLAVLMARLSACRDTLAAA